MSDSDASYGPLALVPGVNVLPERTILFHAGFHKTGTTALQSAFAGSRKALREYGVLYPGNRRSHHRAAMSVTKRTWGWHDRGGREIDPKYWTTVVSQSCKYPGRVFISSEAFALADSAAMKRILKKLDGDDRFHAIFTLRSIGRLLPSSWQQYLKYGLSMRYEKWLKKVFANPPECPPTPNFWRRNDHAGIIERWSELIGPERVTLVVLDESQRDGLFRTFEALLALPEGILVPDPELGAKNRSMSAAEAEMLRQVNLGGAKRWGWPAYEKIVRRGAALRMVESRTPNRDEPGVGTPQWAVEAAQAVGAATAERIRGLGINVIGDLDSLAAPIPAGEAPSDSLCIPVSAAAQAVLGAMSGAMAGRPIPPEKDSDINRMALPPVQQLTTGEAATLLRKRMGEAAAWRLAKARRSLRRTSGK